MFKKLSGFNLSAYMYAPKDDTKHRSNWRQLYNPQEAEELRILIQEAHDSNIDFYYSLAPGLDMVYSEQKDIDIMKCKYDQLVSLGCKSFAILFDDIEPNLIDERDKLKYSNNYAMAQVEISNMIYQHLKKPKFFFCPTEYCESRAAPSVTESVYLNTIGQNLAEGIDFMWSGSRVISRLITEDSIETLTKVIRRKPVIWENLHANDYDRKRVYLGPYSGRSTKLIPKLKGVMTNPNCEFEANYIAIHTLAQWSRCVDDMSPGPSLCNQINVESIGGQLYNPGEALALAIKHWLPHLNKQKFLPPGCNMGDCRARNDESASNQLAKDGDIDICTDEESNVEMLVAEEMTAQPSSADTMTAERNQQAAMSDSMSCDSCEYTDSNGIVSDVKRGELKKEEQEEEKMINFDNMSLLVDMFYLPFEHGLHGTALLNDLKWLRDNSVKQRDVEVQMEYEDGKSSRVKSTATTVEEDPAWLERAEKMTNFCTYLNQLVSRLICDCPNKLLIVELYPYLADMRDLTTLVVDYIKFLRNKASSREQFYFTLNARHLCPVAAGEEQEPWVHRGGLIGDVQRLISA